MADRPASGLPPEYNLPNPPFESGVPATATDGYADYLKSAMPSTPPASEPKDAGAAYADYLKGALPPPEPATQPTPTQTAFPSVTVPAKSAEPDNRSMLEKVAAPFQQFGTGLARGAAAAVPLAASAAAEIPFQAAGSTAPEWAQKTDKWASELQSGGVQPQTGVERFARGLGEMGGTVVATEAVATVAAPLTGGGSELAANAGLVARLGSILKNYGIAGQLFALPAAENIYKQQEAKGEPTGGVGGNVSAGMEYGLNLVGFPVLHKLFSSSIGLDAAQKLAAEGATTIGDIASKYMKLSGKDIIKEAAALTATGAVVAGVGQETQKLSGVNPGAQPLQAAFESVPSSIALALGMHGVGAPMRYWQKGAFEKALKDGDTNPRARVQAADIIEKSISKLQPSSGEAFIDYASKQITDKAPIDYDWKIPLNPEELATSIVRATGQGEAEAPSTNADVPLTNPDNAIKKAVNKKDKGADALAKMGLTPQLKGEEAPTAEAPAVSPEVSQYKAKLSGQSDDQLKQSLADHQAEPAGSMRDESIAAIQGIIDERSNGVKSDVDIARETKEAMAQAAEPAKAEAPTVAPTEAPAETPPPATVPKARAKRSKALTGDEALARMGLKPAEAVPEVEAAQATPAEMPAVAARAEAPLPTELDTPTPRYNRGRQSFLPQFSSDFDKVAYSLVNTKTKSEQHDDYMAWAKKVSGMSEADVIAHGQKVKQAIKDATGEHNGGTVKNPRSVTIDKVGRTGEEPQNRISDEDNKPHESGLRAGVLKSIQDAVDIRTGGMGRIEGREGKWTRTVNGVEQGIDGQTVGALARITLSGGEGIARAAGDHESWHLLKNLGLVSDADDKILDRHTDNWGRDYRITEKWGKLTDGNFKEEARAEAFKDFLAKRQAKIGSGLDPEVKGIFERIAEFFERFSNALMARGFRSANDIFAEGASGELARKVTEKHGTPSERMTAGLGEDFGWNPQNRSALKASESPEAHKISRAAEDAVRNPLVGGQVDKAVEGAKILLKEGNPHAEAKISEIWDKEIESCKLVLDKLSAKDILSPFETRKQTRITELLQQLEGGRSEIMSQMVTPVNQEAFSARQQPFYSQLARQLEGLGDTRKNAQGWLAHIRSGKLQGVSKDEIFATGLDEFLKGKGSEKLTGSEIADYVRQNTPEVVQKKLEGVETKFSQPSYRLPGEIPGTYREEFITLPSIADSWKDGHSSYNDIANPIVRIRYAENMGEDGKPFGVISEIQQPTGSYEVLGKDGERLKTFTSKKTATEYAKSHEGSTIKPIGEFSKMPQWAQDRWQELGLKNMLYRAAERGWTKLAWATGEQISKMYGLENHFSEVKWLKRGDGGYEITARSKAGTGDISGEATPAHELHQWVGNKLAAEIQNSDKKSGSFKGLDLKVGGEGHKANYDKSFPERLEKLTGEKAGEATLKNGPERTDWDTGGRMQEVNVVHSIDIPPTLAEKVLRDGQPLFKVSDEKPEAATQPEGNYSTSDDLAKVLGHVQEDRYVKRGALAQAGKDASRKWEATKGLASMKSWDTLYKKMLNYQEPLKQFVEFMSPSSRNLWFKRTRALRGGDDSAILATLQSGNNDIADRFIEHAPLDFKTRQPVTGGKSLTAILRPLGDKLDEFRGYIISKRALEKEGQGIKTGIDLDAAGRLAAGGAEEFEAIRQELIAYQDHTLRYIKDAGLLSDEQYERIKEMNKDYIPFNRVMDAESTEGAGKGLEARNTVKKMGGSTRNLQDPIESVVKNTYMMINMAERTRVVDALVRQAESTGWMGKQITEGRFKGQMISWVKDPLQKFKVGMKEVPADIVKEFAARLHIEPDQVRGLFKEGTFDVFRKSAFLPKDGVISVWKDGERRLLKVPEGVAEVFQGVDSESMNAIMTILHEPVKWLRAGAILHPEFMVKHGMRGVTNALVFSDNWQVPMSNFFKGLFHLVKKDDMYWQWKSSGAGQASIISLDRGTLEKRLADVMREDTVLAKSLHYVTSPLEGLRVMAEMAELPHRLGTFAGKMERGNGDFNSQIEAAYATREVTVDYNRFGGWGKGMNYLVAFWNVRAQGIDRMARGIADNPLNFFARTTAYLTIPSIALAVANHGDERLKKIPQWMKDTCWCIPVGEHVFIWRKPFELGIVFGSLPERIVESIMDKDPHAFDGWMHSFASNFFPGGIPTALQPLMENWANKSWYFDRQIVPRQKENLPAKYQYSGATSETSKAVADLMSKIPYLSAEASPAKIDNMVFGWTAALGKITLAGIDQIIKLERKATGQQLPPEKPSASMETSPITRAITANVHNADTPQITRFYENWTTEDGLNRAADLKKKEGNFKEAMELQRQVELKPLEPYHKALINIHNIISKIEASRTMDADRKRQMLDRLYNNMDVIATRANSVYDRVKKP